MSRYIDADRLKKHFAWWEGEAKAKEFKEIFDEIIDAQPTADVVDVVRCKECKHYDEIGMDWGECHLDRWGNGHAYYAPPTVDEEGFCKWGERRDDDDEIH